MATSNDALREEFEALTSIYGRGVLDFLYNQDEDVTEAILTIPNVGHSFSLHFPPSYPDEPPSVIGTYHVDENAAKGDGETATEILRELLAEVFNPGQVCIFDLIEEAGPLLTPSPEERNAAAQSHSAHESRSALSKDLSDLKLTDHPNTALSNIPAPEWVLSESLIVNKSTFVARVARVSSLNDAKTSIAHLISTNKRVAAATHNITAWRIKSIAEGMPEITIQDCDDDGESAAGGRLLHLMQLMDIWNVVVVVTRWYGGVKLGPDRFRCINSVAREALVAGGFATDDTAKSGDKAKKKGKK